MDHFREEVKEYREQEEDVLSYALFPQVATDYFKWRQAQKHRIDNTLYQEENKVHPV